MRPHKTVALSAGEWADSLTNISTGDLLTEASHNGEVNCIDSTELSNSHCLQQIPFSCDSFDAAIAAHIYKHQSRSALQPPLHTNTSSIWDGEETCDAFVFQKNSVFSEEFQNASRISPPETSREITSTSSAASGKAQEVIAYRYSCNIYFLLSIKFLQFEFRYNISIFGWPSSLILRNPYLMIPCMETLWISVMPINILLMTLRGISMGLLTFTGYILDPLLS